MIEDSSKNGMSGLKRFRRGVDRATYRKLGEAGLPIGADGRTAENVSRGLRQAAARLSGAPQERLDALAARLPQDARERLAEALARAAGRGGCGGCGGEQGGGG